MRSPPVLTFAGLGAVLLSMVSTGCSSAAPSADAGRGGTGDAGPDVAPDLARDTSGCICNDIYAPVCGVDGRTYPNACAAACVSIAVSHQGACADDGGVDATPARGFCNSASDCVFRRNDGCCGACLAASDTPVPSMTVCNGACVAQPGGCMCTNHRCAVGTSTQNAPCDPQQDTCSFGLKCCSRCPGVAVDGGPICDAPTCMPPTSIGGQLTCPAFG